jgi:hypothetical protein
VIAAIYTSIAKQAPIIVVWAMAVIIFNKTSD